MIAPTVCLKIMVGLSLSRKGRVKKGAKMARIAPLVSETGWLGSRDYRSVWFLRQSICFWRFVGGLFFFFWRGRGEVLSLNGQSLIWKCPKAYFEICQWRREEEQRWSKNGDGAKEGARRQSGVNSGQFGSIWSFLSNDFRWNPSLRLLWSHVIFLCPNLFVVNYWESKWCIRTWEQNAG